MLEKSQTSTNQLLYMVTVTYLVCNAVHPEKVFALLDKHRCILGNVC